jgi:hypothetical protein
LSTAGPLTSIRRQVAALCATGTTIPNPRQQCLDDLELQILALRETNHEIVLGIDANEHIHQSSKLLPFLESTGLIDSHIHPSETISSTKLGSRKIDFLFTTLAIKNHISKSGILAYDTIYFSDHRPIYIDIAASYFSNEPLLIEKAPHRALRSKDTRATSLYIEKMESLLATHNINQRLTQLQSDFEASGSANDHLIQQYEAIDLQVGEFMVCSERHSRRSFNSTKFDWSPTLKACCADLSYLKRQLKLQPHNLQLKQLYKDKTAELKQIREKSQLLRAQFLLSKDATHADIPKLIAAEKRRKSFNLVKSRFGKPRTGLSRIIYENNGQTTSTNDPQEMEELLVRRNQDHLGQARSTPFASGPASTIIQPTSQSAWDNLLTEQIPTTLSDDVQSIIKTLQSISPSHDLRQTLQEPIDMDEFKDKIKETPEKTSSSPSGRHFGHYKTALQSTIILSVLHKLTSIPFQFGFSPSRWRIAIDTMLEKTPGNPHLSKLRIIQLIEADFNTGLKIIWSRRLRSTLRRSTTLDDAQHGCRPSRSTIEPTLNKILTYDISRISRSEGVFVENDASAAFDRIIPALSVLTSYAHGIPFAACLCLFLTTTQLRHHIRTAHGISASSYVSTNNNPLFGCGQGSGASPIIWILSINLLFSATSFAYQHGTSISSPTHNINHERTFDAFVDDTCLSCFTTPQPDTSIVSPEATPPLIATMTTIAQKFTNLLHVIGGKLNLSKCHLVAPVFQDSRTSRYELQTTTLSIVDPATLETSTIPQLGPQDSYRTLGFYIAADGSQKTQISILQGKITQWRNTLVASKLSRHEIFTAYRVFLIPAISYAFPIADITSATIANLYRPIAKHVTNSLGLNQHIPRALLYGPMRLGGLELPDWELWSVSYRLHAMLHNINTHTPTGSLLVITMIWTQLELGIGNFFLNVPYNHPYVQRTWITGLWEAITPYDINFSFPHDQFQGLLRLPKKNDQHLMDIFLSMTLSPSQLSDINYCRIFLRVIFVSDIADAAGTQIDHPYRLISDRAPRRRSYLSWPTTSLPPTNLQWELWLSVLRQSLCTYNFLLRNPLGPWINPTHQHWPLSIIHQYEHLPTELQYQYVPHPDAPTTYWEPKSDSKTLKTTKLVESQVEEDLSFQQPINVASYVLQNGSIAVTTTGTAPPSYSEEAITTEGMWSLPAVSTLDKTTILDLLRHRKYSHRLLQSLPFPEYHPTPEAHNIEWDGLNHFLRNIAAHPRAAFAKFQHQWLPTFHRLHKHNPTLQTDICPLCNEEPETQQHLYCCPDPQAVQARATALAAFRAALKIQKLPRSLIDALCAGLRFLSGVDPPPNPMDHASSMRTYIEHQNNIGWYPLLLGYIPTLLYDSLTFTPRKSRKSWAAQIIRSTYAYHQTIWNNRNSIIHSSGEPTTDILRTRMHLAALSWYDRLDELTTVGRNLLPPDPELIRQLSTPALAELIVQINAMHQLWQRQPRNTQDIRRFFQPRTNQTSNA